MEITYEKISKAMAEAEKQGFIRSDPRFRTHAIWTLLVNASEEDARFGRWLPRVELAEELEKFFFPEVR